MKFRRSSDEGPGGYDLVTVDSMLALGHTITEERVDGNGTFDGWYCIHELPPAAWAMFGGWQPGYPETLKLFRDNRPGGSVDTRRS